MTDTTPQELRAVAGVEIEAAAMSLFQDDTNWADPDPSDGQVKDWWDGQTEDVRARYRLKALHALRAARNNNDRSTSV